jgi:PDZ domain-containing secreted protein
VSDPSGPSLPPPPGSDGSSPPSPIAEEAPTFHWRKIAFLAPVAVILIVLYMIRIPYFVLQPGPAQDVEPLIHIQRHQVYTSQGHLLLTAVNIYQPNVYEALWAWIDKTQSVVRARRKSSSGLCRRWTPARSTLPSWR